MLSIERYKGEMGITGDKTDARTLIARDTNTGEIVAFVGMTVSDEKRAYIENISVTEKYRNQGIGEKLMKDVEEWVRQEKEIKEFGTHTSTGNERAMNLYKRLGYKLTGYTYKIMPEYEKEKTAYNASDRVSIISKNNYEELKELYEEECRYYNGLQDKPDYPKRMQSLPFEEFIKQIGDSNIKTLRDNNGQILGQIIYSINGQEQSIKDIYVRRKYRNIGIGRTLLEDVIAEGQQLEIPVNEINLSTYVENNNGNEWLERQGFKCTGYNQDKKEKSRDEIGEDR